MKRYVQGRTQGEGGKGEAAPPPPRIEKRKRKKDEKREKMKGKRRKEERISKNVNPKKLGGSGDSKNLPTVLP